MRAKEYRKLAWARLSQGWGKPVLVFFLIALISGSVDIIVNLGDISPESLKIATFLGSIAGIISILIDGPFRLSSATVSLAISRDEEYSANDAFAGFKSMGSAIALYLLNAIFTFLWCLLLIVPGIIKAISYSMSFYILHDNPQMDPTEARKRSIEMMNGHKWEYFKLNLSFVGWCILGGLTLGILFLWVVPYIEVANAMFYERIKPRVEEPEIEFIEE